MADQPRRGSVFVKVGPIPRFRVLSDIDAKAEREAAALLKATQKQIKRLIESAPPDPADDLLAQQALADVHVPGQLLKSAGVWPVDAELTRDEKRGLAEIAHVLRTRHGAPTHPRLLIDGDTVPASPEDGDEGKERALKAILAALPFLGGFLRTDRSSARRLKRRTGDGEPRILALSEDIQLDQDIRSTTLRRVFTGEVTEIVKVVRTVTEGTENVTFTIFEGAATWLAARLVDLPALDVQLFEGKTEPATPPQRPPISIEEAIRTVGHLSKRFAYHVPPALEPLAELARHTSMREFDDMVGGRYSAEEKLARRTADVLATVKEQIWQGLYQAARMSGVQDEEASRRASKALETRRATSSWRGAERAAVRLEKIGEAKRGLGRLKRAESLELSKDLGITTFDFRNDEPAQLWLMARRGAANFDDDELVDRPSEEVIIQNREAERLPAMVSSPRFPNEHGGSGPPLFLASDHRPSQEATDTDPEAVEAPLQLLISTESVAG